jgi:hypothetical protein
VISGELMRMVAGPCDVCGSLVSERHAQIVYVPEHRHGAQRGASSFDHLVGEREQPVGYLEAECFHRCQVDHQLEFRRL